MIEMSLALEIQSRVHLNSKEMSRNKFPEKRLLGVHFNLEDANYDNLIILISISTLTAIDTRQRNL